MTLYALGDREPTIDPTAFVHPDAVVIGDVRIGPESSVWPSAVLRGDHGTIYIGAGTSVQDGSVVHCTREWDTTIGDGCRIGNDTLIGSGSVVLQGVIVGDGALVAAQALLTPGVHVPALHTAMGVPAKVSDRHPDATLIANAVETYRRNAHWYAADLRCLD